MILFLNKIDLFENHIKKIPIKSIPEFSDYNYREGHVQDGIDYFKKKFLEKNHSPESKQIYPHVTCATDSKNVQKVFESCRNTILQQNMDESGLW